MVKVGRMANERRVVERAIGIAFFERRGRRDKLVFEGEERENEFDGS